MRNWKLITAALLACAGTAFAHGDRDDDGDSKFVGTWLCAAVRAGTIVRPLIAVFRGDGTFDYFSATTINNTTAPGGTCPLPFDPTNPSNPAGCSATFDTGIFSRLGGHGAWSQVGRRVVNYKSLEPLLDDHGNAAGLFNVDSTMLLTDGDQLCSTRPECAAQITSISLTTYQFSPNVDGAITGQTVILGPGSTANLLCNRFTSGKGFPLMPPPVPTK